MRNERSLCARMLVVTCVALPSCDKKKADAADEHPPVLVAADASLVEPIIGGDPDRQPRVAFAIDAVYPHARPASQAPWHEDGGDWTFFDAHTRMGVPFGFGFEKREGGGGRGFSFGKAVLTVPTADDGARLVTLFSGTFGGKAPPPAARQALRFKPFAIVFLGERESPQPAGGFGGAGNWTATKLFLQRQGLEAEVFFNFDLTAKQGEFAEKDADYAGDMVAFLALELRDGERPPRSAATDPSVAASGPRPGPFHAFGPPGAEAVHFEAGGKRLVYTVKEGTETKVVSASLKDPSDAKVIVRLKNAFSGVSCAKGADDPCVIVEHVPSEPGVWSSNDPNVLTLVQRARGAQRKLEGPWGDKGEVASGAAEVSPDGSWVVVSAWTPKSSGTGQYRVAYFVPVEGGAPVKVKRGEETLEVVGWTTSGPGLRAVLRTGLAFDKDAKHDWLLADPKTGATKAIDAAPADAVAEAGLSPDGKRRVACDGDRAVVVTDVVTKAARRFAIFEEDRPSFKDGACVDWMSARYLSYGGQSPAFLDAETMKVSYVFDAGAEVPPRLMYDAALRTAVSTANEGIRVAEVGVR